MASEHIVTNSADACSEKVLNDGGRRRFLRSVAAGTTLVSVSAGLSAGCVSAATRGSEDAPPAVASASIRGEIRALVDRTPLIDTHEHLVDEARRVDPSKLPDGFSRRPQFVGNDFSVLFSHYAASDLRVAGMSEEDFERFSSPDTDLDEKWRLVAAPYARTRNTAYLRNVRESIRILYGEEDIREDNYESISNRLAVAVKPGYYRHILNDVCNVEYCHVNCLDEVVFMDTAQPELLSQDINFGNMCELGVVAGELGREIGSLMEWRDGVEELNRKPSKTTSSTSVSSRQPSMTCPSNSTRVTTRAILPCHCTV